MHLLIGTADGLHRLADGRLDRLADGNVAVMAPGDDGTVWAVVDDTVLQRGRPDGTFATVAEHPQALRCLVATDDGLLAGTAGAELVRLDGDRLTPVEGFRHAPGREGWYTPWGGPPDTRSLAAAADGTLYANVHVGGILRSRDGGATWEPTIDVDADVHEVIVADERVLAATARGLGVSDDRGATWHWRTDGLHARYARAVAVGSASVLLSVSEGPRGARSAIYRGARHGGSLARCREGLPEWFTGNVDTGCLVAAGAHVAAADAGTVHVSDDEGGTWRLAVQDVAPVRCLAALPDRR